MIIGVPKEIKANEHRVALLPAGVQALVNSGHKVVVETGAGQGSGYEDDEYAGEGAELVSTAKEVWDQADMIVKVKEPLSSEYAYFREGQIVFTYLHLAAEEALTKALLDRKVTGVAYETIQLPNRSLPLLTPMSEVAGRMSVQIGAQFLEKFYGGSGVLLGGVPGVPPGKVVIIGGGIVGVNAAKMAVGLGADVTVIELSAERMAYLDDLFMGRVKTFASSPYHISEAVKEADLVVGAVLIPGARAPKLVTEEMVANMKKGSVIVDVAVDQGGIVETIDRVTTHADPTYVKHGVVHYAVANIPGAVPRTATQALTNATLPYILQLTNKGLHHAISDNESLRLGVNTYNGKLTYEAVAQSLDIPYTTLDLALQ